MLRLFSSCVLHVIKIIVYTREMYALSRYLYSSNDSRSTAATQEHDLLLTRAMPSQNRPGELIKIVGPLKDFYY